MSTLTTAEKAVILLDGSPVMDASQIVKSSNAFEIVVEADGSSWVYANAVDPACLVTVRKAGREGSVAFDIVEAPLAVTLGTPEPK